MASIIKGILGEVSGLVGTVVGAVVRGIPTIRSRPRKSSKPAVLSQINQRSKFAIVNKFMSPIKEVLNIGFQSVDKKMSPVNAAVQYALLNSVTGVSPNFALNYPSIVISKGTLPGSTSMAMNPVPDGRKLVFNWDQTLEELNPTQQLERRLDRVTFLFYNVTKGKFLRYLQYADRDDNTLSLTIPLTFAGDTLHVYFFFSSPDGKLVSDSGYLGIGKIPA